MLRKWCNQLPLSFKGLSYGSPAEQIPNNVRDKNITSAGAQVAIKDNWTNSEGETGPNKVVEWVEPLLRIREVLSQNLHLQTVYRLLNEGICDFLQSLLPNAELISQITAGRLPYKLCQIYYCLVAPPFGITGLKYDLLRAPIYKLKIHEQQKLMNAELLPSLNALNYYF